MAGWNSAFMLPCEKPMLLRFIRILFVFPMAGLSCRRIAAAGLF